MRWGSSKNKRNSVQVQPDQSTQPQHRNTLLGTVQEHGNTARSSMDSTHSAFQPLSLGHNSSNLSNLSNSHSQASLASTGKASPSTSPTVNDTSTVQISKSLQSVKLQNSSSTSTISTNTNGNQSRPFSTETYDSSILKVGYLNKGSNISNYNQNNQDSWRIYKAELKGPTLSLYKLPADVNIKSFDPSLASSTQQQQFDQDIRQKRMSTFSKASVDSSTTTNTAVSNTTTLDNSPSPSSLNSNAPFDINRRAKLKYASEVYPHPDLELSSANEIVSGTLESICHTILFNSRGVDKFTYDILSGLPLFGDIKSCLRIFIEYAFSFTNSSSQRLSLRNSNVSGKIGISNDIHHELGQRLGMVCGFFIDEFPGMLLDSPLNQLLSKLIQSLSSYDENLYKALKNSFNAKERIMRTLTAFNNLEYDSNVSKDLTNIDTFLMIPVDFLAEQINLIHLKFNSLWNPKDDISLLFEIPNVSYHKLNPLVFNPVTNMHFIGRLITTHLFGSEQQHNDEFKRAQVLKKWIKLGSQFDRLGDMVAWMAIATTICSIPILRLTKSWRNLDDKYIKLISLEWAPIVFELDKKSMVGSNNRRVANHVVAPRGLGTIYSKDDVIPYLGDLTIKFMDTPTLKQCDNRILIIKRSFIRWNEYLNNIGDVNDPSLNSSRNRKENPEITKQLYNILTNHVHSAPLTQGSVMGLSLSVEPDHTADYSKIGHDSRTPLITGSYLPTLFTEVLPNYRLFNQKILIGAGGFPVSSGAVNAKIAEKLLTDQLKVTGNDNIDLRNWEVNSMLPKRKPNQQQTLLKSVRDIFNIGSDEFHIKDDLIFKALANENMLKKSRPASVVLENPSNKRLSQISTGASNSKRNSNRFSVNSNEFQKQLAQQLQSSNGQDETGDAEDDVFGILNHPSLINSLIKPLNVVLKAGTFDKLIDVLVLTSSVFSNRIKTEDIENYLGKSNVLDNQFLKLKMDNEIFTATFFQTYKSFSSTFQLLSALTSRFTGAKSAALSISRMNNIEDENELKLQQIDWISQIADIHDEDINWKYVGNIQIGVLEAVLILVSEHYKDFINDLQNKASFIELFRAIDYSLSHEWKEVQARYAEHLEMRTELRDIYNVLVTSYKKVRKIFIKNSYSPVDSSLTFNDLSDFNVTPEEAHLLSFNDLQLPADFRSAEVFVNKLDKFINDIFISIGINDWIYVFQLLEIQSVRSLTSLFKYRTQYQITKNEDRLEILNVFKWISALYSDNLEDKILKKFPNQVQALFRLHDNLEKYFKLQISDVNISKEVRTARMTAILQILTISRLRMESVNIFDSSPNADCISPHVPSFIETAIAQAIVSPESRYFSNSWICAASTLKKETIDNFDDLLDLLPDFETDDLTPDLKEGLTPCIGWFIERLLEISNFVPNMSIENSKLINFDKRRFTYNCISNIIDMNYHYEDAQGQDVCQLQEGFQILYKISHIPLASLDNIEIVANAESGEYSSPSIKLFGKFINSELEKIKRDSAKRETLKNQEIDLKRNLLLSQTRSHSPALSVSSSTYETSSMSSRKAKGASTAQSPSKASMGKKLGGFFKSVRPFSINVASGWSASSDKILHPDDLPDISTFESSNPKHNKPFQQIQVFGTKTLFIHSNIEGFFKIIGESVADEYVFQAVNNQEAQNWINAFNLSKRYSYLSKDSKTTSKVFGVPIFDLCERECSFLPKIVEKLLQEIELRGLDETGLYRIPGSVASINSLRQAFDEGNDFTLEDDRWFEINTLAGCFKSYLRELPETPFTKELLPKFVEANSFYASQGGNNSTNECYISTLKSLVMKLPKVNYNLLKRLFEHLQKVDLHAENNRMDAVNLAIVFAMSFVDNDNLGMGMGSDLGALQNIIQCLIKNHELIFDEFYQNIHTSDD